MMTDFLPLPLVDKLTETDAKALAHALRDTFIARDCDIRTLGPLKILHRLSEALGKDNWQRLRDVLKRNAFMNTLMTRYGVSEAYADAAYLTLSDRSSDIPGEELAIRYATRFGIAPLSPSDEVNTPRDTRFSDPACAQHAKAQLASLMALAEENDTEAASESLYGAGVVKEVVLVLSSDTVLYVTINPDTQAPLKATIRSTGFGASYTQILNDTEFTAITEVLADDIQQSIDSQENA